jgi:hypothetical protein
MDAMRTDPQPGAERTFSPYILVPGYLLMVGSAALACRLIWEMTSLTWQMGPQMIGFSLAHGYLAPLLFCPIVLFVWLVGCLITMLVWKLRKRQIRKLSYASALIAVTILGVLLLPQGFWDRVFVEQLAKSPHAAELLVNAAGAGELGTVQAMLKRGISINAVDHTGDTPLHMAAALGNEKMVSYLIQNGARVNALNLYGDSPLERAASMFHPNVVAILAANGGQDIKGDAEQRNLASKQIVARDIEEMEKRQRESRK